MIPWFRSPIRLLAALCLALPAGACSPPVTTVAPGPLAGDAAWSGTVRVAGDIVVPEDTRLVIAPGTRVLFEPPPPGTDRFRQHPNFPGSELIVRGTLVAEGTPGRPILFAAADPDAPAGSWGGVNLAQATSNSFSHCIFRQADSALHSRNSEVFIEQCLFENNLVAIRFHSSAILIENNLLRNNATGIRFHDGAPVICRNRLVANGKAFFITAHPREVRIEANDIVDSREFAVVLGEEVPEDVNMAGNFWGEGDPGRTIFDRRRSDYLGRVRVEPRRTEPVPSAGISWSP